MWFWWHLVSVPLTWIELIELKTESMNYTIWLWLDRVYSLQMLDKMNQRCGEKICFGSRRSFLASPVSISITLSGWWRFRCARRLVVFPEYFTFVWHSLQTARLLSNSSLSFFLMNPKCPHTSAFKHEGAGFIFAAILSGNPGNWL